MTNFTTRDVTEGSEYANSNPEVADIPSPGVLVTKAVGSTVITATYGESTADLPVFVYKQNTNLSSIIVNGSPIQDFTPEQTDYYFTLDSNDREVPSVTAVTEDPNATAAIRLPAAVPGIVYITAKAKIVLGETIQEYKIKKAEP